MSTTLATSTVAELVRFLLSRLDDDEATVKRMSRAGQQPTVDGVGSPARLRADLAAKRRIIGTVQQLLVLRDQPSEKPVRDAATQVLRSLAQPYSFHSAYRREWSPGPRH